ncbi:MAG: ribosome biogenesis GTP-binding protein YihA/YsxC [Actinomycetota bacterium]
MSRPFVMRFVTSADRVEGLPDSEAEVAVVGRSNVGKSSLINALGHSKKLAKVSNTPGRTRLLNLFAIEGGGSIVDLPGYGYAKASKELRAGWQRMIDRYLLERDGLAMVVVLVDGLVGPTDLDQEMLDWLRAHDIPHTVVATKHDKVKASIRTKRKRALAEGCQLEPGDIVWVSSQNGTGIDRLRSLMLGWLE